MPAFEFEPTRDRFNIVALGENVGEAVVCLREFAAGEVVFACTGFFSSTVTLFSLQITPTLHLHDPYFYGKLMHSCDPNVRVDVTTRQFIATRAIRAGEPVTLDYAASEDYLFRNFPCRCGAAHCRGIVAGRKQNSPERAASQRPPGRSLTLSSTAYGLNGVCAAARSSPVWKPSGKMIGLWAEITV